MALDKATLKSDLLEIFSKSNSPEDAAQAIANSIDKYVKTATVTITALTGEVKVKGSPSAQANVSPLTFTGGDDTHLGGLS
jgi:hypothetical protein